MISHNNIIKITIHYIINEYFDGRLPKVSISSSSSRPMSSNTDTGESKFKF